MTMMGQLMARLRRVRRVFAWSTSVQITACDACRSSAGTSTDGNTACDRLVLRMLKLREHLVPEHPTRARLSR